MDNIAINVSNYEQFYKARCPENDSSYPSDYTAHIYDPIKKTERTVKTANSAGGHNIVRLVHGAKCDILPRRVHASDTSMFVTNYAAGFWIDSGKAAVSFGRAAFSNAHSGLACAFAYSASSNSFTIYGGRLSFRGKIRDNRIERNSKLRKKRGRESRKAAPSFFLVQRHFFVFFCKFAPE